jgi:hypothetical protein
VKQVKSLFRRLVWTEKFDDKIVLSKYDYGIHREKVTIFHENLLYESTEKKRGSF